MKHHRSEPLASVGGQGGRSPLCLGLSNSETAMRIEQRTDGKFVVISLSGDVMQVFRSNAEAWRWVDRHDDNTGPDQDRHERISHSIRNW
jgi:hypothetical protein